MDSGAEGGVQEEVELLEQEHQWYIFKPIFPLELYLDWYIYIIT